MRIENGDRIAQFVVQRVEQVIWSEVDALSDTARGAKGFGSTGLTLAAEVNVSDS